LGVTLSVGRTGQCWDNALAESFFATLKGELIDTRPWPTRAAAHAAIFEYIESWYNLRRRHSALGYHSPADYENEPRSALLTGQEHFSVHQHVDRPDFRRKRRVGRRSARWSPT
jgi:transposase InsO family protein